MTIIATYGTIFAVPKRSKPKTNRRDPNAVAAMVVATSTGVPPDVEAVYTVLRRWALSGKVETYTDLSRDYQKEAGDWFEPHGSWDAPLGELNRRLHAMGAPALSALVILKLKGEPGGAFWGCAPNVPARPTGDGQRRAEWRKIVNAVHAYAWPAALA